MEGEGGDGSIMFPSMTQCPTERGSFPLHLQKHFLILDECFLWAKKTLIGQSYKEREKDRKEH